MLGGRQPITGPAPQAGRRGLLNAALNAPTLGGADWQHGVTFEPEACDALDPIPVGCWSDVADAPSKDALSGEGLVTFDPFVVLGVDECSVMDRGRDREGRARRNLTATESWQVERQVFDGAATTQLDVAEQDSPWLTQDGGSTTVTTSATAPAHALAALERELAECLHGQRGMIHATADVVTLWHHGGNLRIEGNLLLTALDTIVVAGSGYSGAAPGGAAAAAGSSWAYGTGLVYYRQGEIVPVGDEASRVDRSVNTHRTIVEREVLAVWAPCCVLAAQVDITAA